MDHERNHRESQTILPRQVRHQPVEEDRQQLYASDLKKKKKKTPYWYLVVLVGLVKTVTFWLIVTIYICIFIEITILFEWECLWDNTVKLLSIIVETVGLIPVVVCWNVETIWDRTGGISIKLLCNAPPSFLWGPLLWALDQGIWLVTSVPLARVKNILHTCYY